MLNYIVRLFRRGFARLVCVLVLAGAVVNLGASDAEYRTNTSDPLIRSMPQTVTSLRSKGYEVYLQKVGEYIAEKAVDEYDKVKKIHDWVALNIRYDAAAFFSNRIPDQSVSRVVSSGLAVCAGYAEVFDYLCGILDVECEIVTGYARGYGRSVFGNEYPGENHAWNKVKINGKSYLIDTTWDSGYVNGRSFSRKYRTDYLFMNPEHFIYDHFPNNPEDQLLSSLVSTEDFLKLPLVYPGFFDVIGDCSPALQRVTEVKGKFLRVNLDAKAGIHFMLDLVKSSKKYNAAADIFTRNGKRILTIAFPDSGDYKLSLFASPDASKTHAGIAEFGFKVTIPSNSELIPGDAELFLPEQKSLERNRENTIKINPGNWKYIALIKDNNWQYLSPDDEGIFTLSFTPRNAGVYYLAASETEYGVYETLTTFNMR